MLHGPQVDVFDLRFALPSECADQLASGEADIGIVPVIEMARQKLEYFRGTGIACHGPVRSILLVSKVPFREIQTLATDSGSRTSVMLARVILAEKYGVEPKLISRRADLAPMLGEADAALLIGDAALRVDPATLPFETLDLGGEWTAMTGLPMVFAVWAGRKDDRRASATRAPSSTPAATGWRTWTKSSQRGGGAWFHGGAGARISDAAHRVRAGRARLRRARTVFCSTRRGLKDRRSRRSIRMMTRAEAIDLYQQRRPDRHRHGGRRRCAASCIPEGVVSYIIDRNINYTNFCTEYCSFCAFYRPMGHAEGYVHPKEVIFEKIQETIDLGGTGILMQGGLHPELKIEWYEDLLRSIKQRFDIWCHCFSAPEIVNIAKVSDLTHARHAGAPARRGARFAARRRRGDSGRRSAPPHQPPEIVGEGLDRRASGVPCAGHALHRDHDVRNRRDHRAAHESFRHRAPDAGRKRRIHGVHPVELPARKHVAGAVRQGRGDGGGVS